MRTVQYRVWDREAKEWLWTGRGVFHTWAQEADDEGQSNPVAIVEHADGTVTCIYAGNVRFFDDVAEPAAQSDSKDAELRKAINEIPTVIWWHQDGHPSFNNANGEDLILRKSVLSALAQQAGKERV